MSRLIVKGLPRRYDEKLVRELFSSNSDVTDSKVMRTADGRSRQFAFVGFRNAADATLARQRLHNTYVDAAQIAVEVARAIGEDGGGGARPWSKYSHGSSAFAERNVVVEKEAVGKVPVEKVGKWGDEDDKANGGKSNDKAFEEFKDAVAKRGKKAVWTDTTQATVKKSLVASRKTGGEGLMLQKSHVVFGEDDDCDEEGEDELYEELPGPSAGKEGEDEKGEKEGGEEEAKSCGVAEDEEVDDASYFQSKVKSSLDDDAGTDGNWALSSSDSESDSDSKSVSDSDSSDSDSDSDDGSTVEVERVGGGAEAGLVGEAGAAVVVAGTGPTQKEYNLEDVDVSETGRLFVRNLSYSVTEDELENLFERFGAISDIHLVHDPVTKKSRGVAFVLFVVPENAAKALTEVDRKIFHGRLLHVLPGRARPVVRNAEGLDSSAPGSNTFKSEREAARKESARTGGDSNAFNALYMSTDAVAGVMADRYGVGKGDVFGAGGGEAGSAAVRLAAGEARLQMETREYFLENGIDISVAQANVGGVRQKKQSRNAFLAKNLPARTTESELEGVFEKFGSLDRLLLIPSGLLAVIVFDMANDAKKAYSALAYTRYKDTPLYLEWLPAEAVVGNSSKTSAALEKRAVPTSVEEENMKVEDVKAGGDDTGAATLAESLPQVSVFVKNLNFDTRDDALRKHIVKTLKRQPKVAASIRAVSVATKPNPKDPAAARLSYGYGFVEFASERDAGEAVKLAQGTKLDGHTLELRLANRPNVGPNAKKRSRTVAGKRKPSTKLMIRNLAFEATSRDVRSLFGTFGQVKSIRIPRKQDGSHRGFGFVEFVSKNEATAALNALGSTHLYGRHLVIDYADETQDGIGSLEELQAKAAKQVSKRRRIDGKPGEGDTVEEVDDDDARMMDEMYG